MPRYTPAEIEAAVAAWQARLGLVDWKLTVKVGRFRTARRAAAEVEVEYKSAVLYFNPAGMEKFGDELHETVVHELAHIPNWGLSRLAERYAGSDTEKLDRINDELEIATTLTERMVLRLTGGRP